MLKNAYSNAYSICIERRFNEIMQKGKQDNDQYGIQGNGYPGQGTQKDGSGAICISRVRCRLW